MEEKISVLETLGALKGFVTGSHWHIIHGTKNKSQNQEHKEKSSGSHKIEENGSNIWNSVVEKSLRESKEYNAKQAEGGDNKEILSDKMEEIKSETNIPPECNAHIYNSSKESFLNVNTYNDKTEDCDNCKSKESLEFLPEINGGDACVEDGGEDINGNIPSSTKFPLSVQDWINHLSSKEKSSKNTSVSKIEKDEFRNITNSSAEEATTTAAARLSREASIQSNSSLDSLLDSRKPDPVEIFLNLGFGGVPGVNMENCRIPKRFLVPSKCRGGDWNEFLKRELIQVQNFECSSLGFRGLSGPSYRRPSAIVANIMEKLRENSVGPPHPRSRFSAAAKRIINEKITANKFSPESQSVLSPDSRKFLQNQGKISPEVPRRRIIFGQKSFAFARDGEFVEVESSAGKENSSKDNFTAIKKCSSDGDDPTGFPDPQIILKLRRSSLQKQKKVEDDSDIDDVFFAESFEGCPPESKSSAFPTNDDCSKKAEKIPRRFFSSTNLKALAKDDDLSEVMRLEVEKEIRTLSEKVKDISSQDLPSVLKQVKQLRSRLENNAKESSDV